MAVGIERPEVADDFERFAPYLWILFRLEEVEESFQERGIFDVGIDDVARALHQLTEGAQRDFPLCRS